MTLSLVAAAVAVLAIAAAYLRGRFAGALRERDKAASTERDSYAQSIRDMARAADAARNVRPDDGGVQDDPDNRDNQA
jgi:hypothetical protein